MNKNLYFDRLKEIEVEESQGIIVDQEQIKQDLQLALLNDIETQAEKNTLRHSKGMVYLGIAILLVISVAAYLKVGGYQQLLHREQVMQALPELRTQAQRVDGTRLTTAQMRDLALGIRTELYYQPDNVNDWMLLGDINIALKNAHTTLQAFAKAYRLAPNDPYIQLRYGQMLLRSNEISDIKQGEWLLTSLLQQDKNNLQVMSALAFNAYSHGDFQRAIELWGNMLLLLDDSQRIMIIKNSIERAKIEQNANEKSNDQ